MGKKSAPPAAPDYTKAAESTAASNQEAQTRADYTNRPTINTPFGQESWSQSAGIDPSTGKPVTNWTQNTTLTPAMQEALNAQQAIDMGKSNLALGSMDRLGAAYQQPFDWQNLTQMGGNVNAGQMANVQGGGAGQFANVDPSQYQAMMGKSPDMSSLLQMLQGGPTAGPLQNQINTANLPGMSGGVGGWSGTIDGGATGKIDLGQLTNRGALVDSGKLNPWGASSLDASFGDASRQRVEQALLERLKPTQDYETQRLQTQLANQGLTPGSAAFDRAMAQQQTKFSTDQFNALMQGGQEQMNQFGMALQGNNYANQMRGQGLNEQLAIGGQADAQRAASLNEQMQREQMVNQGHALRSQDQTSTGNLANQSASIANQGAQIGNQAAMDAFNQQMQMAGLYNQTQNQQFQQGLAGAQFGNQTQNQAYNQLMGAAGMDSANALQGYNMGMGSANLYNQNQQNAFGQDVTAANMWNQNQGQDFSQQMQTSQYQNQLRQQQIAEQMQARNMPLNEMNAILSGTQVGMPTMPSFNTSQSAGGTNLLGAAQQQYQAQMNNYNAQQQQGANTMGTIGSVASMAAMAF
jgi:hypothetical protein